MDISLRKMIDDSIQDYFELKSFLLTNGQVSQESFTTEVFRKFLLVSCASLFENQIQELISLFISKQTDNTMIQNLIKRKVIERQYHTYFDWKNKNANPFYSLFGEEFKNTISQKLKEKPEIKSAEKSFIEIGYERNLMVHENFLGYQFNKTVEEVQALYNDALLYINFLQEIFI